MRTPKYNSSYSSAFRTGRKAVEVGGQCFECGLWFRKDGGYASCAEHGKRSPGGEKQLCVEPPRFRSYNR